ncbi:MULTISPECIES: PTS mannose/fructose/sorbose/N-acetylgalactosamine transporter subunit IIC [Bacillota]|jgi:fructoselysine and glucoselysine-specific PTS system IIC component|uniref:PTS sugar transporter subunit IIC n=2 Tax=Amedibacillus TaxID=2749846 RepID=A0A7G9GR78_9FIRM|nr:MULTISPECIES: PTS sugar transporter subunit IIC [Bacillota]QNM13310.1 PTS sugar transporter subunit IIC [[Eubacterium] hominis]MCH4285519.1 PTS sugar transporter subunit IIC [Amedibacillus hominis]RGB52163.1 PTS sugar transporter subunit IIC [Absiella sp. AM22-9]RGB58914.1 PTS sugar transporter subunit IIC [Absiella sp. AM10-20]RHU10450.1 PTS sugar transporter subunit IIC [Absiella sp. AM27-20]
MLTAVLIGLIGALGVMDFQFGSLYINRPIVLGPLVGLVLGDVTQGLIIGANLELFFMGAVSIGAYIPPDSIVGGILATAFAISTGNSTEAAIALAMPIGLISLAVGNFLNVFNSVILRFTDKYAEEGKYGGIVATHWMIGILNVLRRFLLVFFAFYLGVDKMQGLIDAIPTVLIDGMDAAAGLLPALGFAMLMRMILNKQIIPYFFLGFICAAYLGMPVLGVAILGLIIVVVQFGFLNPKNETATASINEEVDDDDF